MKTIKKLIEELSIAMPFKESDMDKAYRLGRLNMLVELLGEVKGYPVNGVVRGIITEESLKEKMEVYDKNWL